MKKKELETLEKINEERKLDKETKEKIRKKVLKNFIFATVILLFFIILKLIALNLNKQVAVLVYKILSVVLFIATIILFEVAYKKDNDRLAITSIEMFFLSIITLLAPYIFINRANVYTSSVGVLFTIYYAIKNFIIYRKEKNNYLKGKNDITQIVKKESKDELAQEQLEKIRQEKEEKNKKKTSTPKTAKITTKTTDKLSSATPSKEEQTKVATPKRRGRPRKTTQETTTKTTERTTEQNETPPKRKRGRPKKVKNEE